MLTSAVLAFNLDAPTEALLKPLCGQLGLQLHNVPPADFDRTLGALIGLPAAAPKRPGGLGRMPFGETILLMANLTQPQFDAFLNGMRARGAIIPLKAVLTPSNVGWDAYQLRDELLREHEALRGNKA